MNALNYQQSAQVNEQQSLNKESQTQSQTKRLVTVSISSIEKCLYITLITIIIALTVFYLSLKHTEEHTSNKIQDLDHHIEQQHATNNSIKASIDQKKSYHNIKKNTPGMKIRSNIKSVK